MDYGLTETQVMIRDLCGRLPREDEACREHYDESGEFPGDREDFAEADLLAS